MHSLPAIGFARNNTGQFPLPFPDTIIRLPRTSSSPSPPPRHRLDGNSLLPYSIELSIISFALYFRLPPMWSSLVCPRKGVSQRVQAQAPCVARKWDHPSSGKS
ncbi:hypothetical protein M407DRAFT_35134 [Tulasnella calospora MUT 4182]|uniref:Uncharacterized protein n=1 Tax=Tulasnella calospora MUT 4182 TaxID=1051891 RepID=A0A0C3PLW5_9AGAM|nr:hypothetical protein M407DRAFT_35169 [Tulasnella calospora MUT 4182]KIO15318.1 hypothetical protein M407DRAFT_35134 [Tulasnella calospora MUT 4182]